MTSGAGAWSDPKLYWKGMVMPADDFGEQRARWGVIAFQRELARRGYLIIDAAAKLDGTFGPKTTAATVWFQRDSALPAPLEADGKIGPATARRLFAPFVIWWQAALGIPDNLLGGMIRGESAFDPGAEGTFDADDRGIGQFNRRYYPDITDEVAYSKPTFCIQRAADILATVHTKFVTENPTMAEQRPSVLWDAAVANHNNPSKARAWVRTGQAPDEQIARYVASVRAAASKPL